MRISFEIKNYKNRNTFLLKKQKKSLNSKTNFTGMRCSEKGFKIKGIQNLHCPVCGLIMLNDSEQKKFVDEVSSKKGVALKEAFEKYENESVFVLEGKRNEQKPILKPQKRQIVEIIKQLALENPELSLAELVRLRGKTSLESLIKKQSKIMDELEEYISSSNLKEAEMQAYLDVVKEYRRRSEGLSEVRFKRKNFIHDMQAVSYNNEEIMKNIIQIATKMPKSDNEIDAFFVKYSDKNRSSKEIAKKFVWETTPTAEHLVPKSKGGKNRTDNYICDCAGCNSARSNVLFEDWCGDIPNFKEELQKYLADVQRALDIGELNPDYDSYIEEIIKVISNISNGKIQLQVPESSSDEKRKAMILKRKEKIEEITKGVQELGKRIRTLRKEIKELEQNPDFDNISQYFLVQSQIEREEQKIKLKTDELEGLKRQNKDLSNKLKTIEETSPHSALETREEASIREAIKKTEEEIEDINKIIELSKDKLQRLRKKEAVLDGITNISIDLSKLIDIAQKLDELDSIQTYIETLKNSIYDERFLYQRLEDIENESQELALQNEEIIRNGKVDINDDSAFLKYKHYEILFDMADQMLECFSGNYKSIPQKDADEIIQISQNEIREKMIALFEKDNVRYFANKETIAENEEEAVIIKTRIEEIEEVLNKINRLCDNIKEILGDDTLEELKSEYERLNSKQSLQNRIQSISSLRTELENLQDTIAYNNKILTKLRYKYMSMSNSEFNQSVSLLY